MTVSACRFKIWFFVVIASNYSELVWPVIGALMTNEFSVKWYGLTLGHLQTKVFFSSVDWIGDDY
jgi:uncharacterized membrane protein